MSDIDYEQALERFNILSKMGKFSLGQLHNESDGENMFTEYMFSFTAVDFAWSTPIDMGSATSNEECMDEPVAEAVNNLWDALHLELWDLCGGSE
jgi:hypothetical protein